MAAPVRYQRALQQALRDEMQEDPDVIVLGEDVRQALRGVSRGLHADFGDARVLDMPLSEQAFTGFAMGAALSGFRPVVEYQIPSLVFTAFEQIVNQAQKFRLMSGGQAGVPVTYLVPGSGARNGLAGQHSDSPYSMLAQAGVRTVVPGTPSDAYWLFREAIRDDDPVAVLAPAASLGSRGEIDERSSPIGLARIARAGSDLTLVASGHLVAMALEVAEAFSGDFSIEVVDARTIHPLDRATLRQSAERTRRLVAVDDNNLTCGFAAEVVASVVEQVELLAPPARVTRADATIPFAPILEAAVLPSKEQLKTAILAQFHPRPCTEGDAA